MGPLTMWLLLWLGCSSTTPFTVGPLELPPAEHASEVSLSTYRGLDTPLSQDDLENCMRRARPPAWTYAVLEIRTDAVLFAGRPVASPLEIRDLAAPSPSLVAAAKAFGDATRAARDYGCLDTDLSVGRVLVAADARLPSVVVAGGLTALFRAGFGEIDVLVADETADSMFPRGGGSQVSLRPTSGGFEVIRQVVYRDAPAEPETRAAVAREALAAALGTAPDVTLTLRATDTYGDVVAIHDVVSGAGGRLVLGFDAASIASDGFAVPPPSGPKRTLADEGSVSVLLLHAPAPGDGFWMRLDADPN